MNLQPAPDPLADPTPAVAERQLALLGELAAIAMAAARAFGESAVAAAEAEKMILAEDCFVPEVGRARACGAKDAADSLQKVSRAVRLTMKLEMAVAEIVRDLRAGIVPVRRDEAASAGDSRRIVIGEEIDAAAPRSAPDADDDGSPAPEERLYGDRERIEFDRAECLPRGAYPALVKTLAADVGAAIDWPAAAVRTRGPAPREAAVLVAADRPFSAKREAALSP